MLGGARGLGTDRGVEAHEVDLGASVVDIVVARVVVVGGGGVSLTNTQSTV